METLIKRCSIVPNDVIDFFNGVLYLVESVRRFDAQFKNQPVDLIDDQRYLDSLLKTMPDDGFGITHDLEGGIVKRGVGTQLRKPHPFHDINHE